ncbi:MAG TPA: aminotransferase class I/II-fold pyridoxal phosphate-dependent enzyme [Candidatus Binatia bacterium]|nr:aminotransferase class I/II-fold pyridoxal phosphate-dependent enzyme [Candidatus Binatia bacterium]
MALRLPRFAAHSAGRTFAADRLTEIELSPIKAVELRASRIPGVVSLAQGIPSFDTPEPIKRYAAEKLAAGECAKYSLTPGLPQLRELIAESLWREDMRYDPDGEIIVTCGAIEAVTATLLATINPGDEVLVMSPTYTSYLPAIRLAGGVPRFVALDEDANFDLNPEAIASSVTRRTAALLLCNPNNPTGTIFSRPQVERMLAVAERHDLAVISDEVYKDFVYTDAHPFSPAQVAAARGRVVRIVSFSKAYGMTGWRVAFLHGAREPVSEILKVHDALVTCAPVISQHAAVAALTLGESFIAEFRAQFRRRRDRVIAHLDGLSSVFDYQRPNASYFVFPRVKDIVPMARDSVRLAHDILERAHVALVPGAAFGPTGEAHLRFCYARADDDIEVAFARLADYFNAGAARGPVAAPVVLHAPSRAFSHVGIRRRTAIATLHALARLYLARRRPIVIAIAGSRGKTVLKRLLVEALAPHRHVRANPLSYNTEIGVPLAVLNMQVDARRVGSVARGLVRAAWSATFARDALDVLVLELGARRPGDMAAHLRTVRPDIAVITALTPDFSEDHEALEVLRGEVAVVCADVARRGGQLWLCGDDPSLTKLAAELPTARWFSRAQWHDTPHPRQIEIDGELLAVERDVVGDSNVYGIIVAAEITRRFAADTDALRDFLAGRAESLSNVEPFGL